MAKNKVVFVDFRRGKRPTSGGFGGSPKLLLTIFVSVLVVELLLVAALYPSAIGRSFFGPTVIAVAVACTLGARRLIARLQVAALHRRTVGEGSFHEDDDHTGRTLH